MTAASRPAVVINADDLGRSPRVNEAIFEAFRRGLITSASVMSNMPAFDEACSTIRALGLQGRIGVHLNLTQGEPLSEPIRNCPRFVGADGSLRRRHGTIWRLTNDEATAVAVELSAQMDAVLAHGISPSHLDSHHHVHTQWPISTLTIRLAHRYGVPALRLTRNCGPGPGWARRAYKVAFNTRLRREHLARVRYFGSARDAAFLPRLGGPIEIMVHPELDEGGVVVDAVSGAGLFDDAESLETVIARWQGIGLLVSHRELE